LARAAAAAAAYGNELLIEEQVQGDNYRLLYLDGQLIDAFVRRPPSVVGDGRSTVAALVRRVNEQRLGERDGLSQVLIPVDFDMHRTLARQGLSLRSVPEEGRRVAVKTVVNDNGATDNSTVMDLLDRTIIEAGQRAVQSLRVRFAGIDVITANPAVSLADSGGVILEVNSPPGLYYHYHKRDGAFPAAFYVLKRLLVDDTADRGAAYRDWETQMEGTWA
jgi:cyanophycin synthetase